MRMHGGSHLAHSKLMYCTGIWNTQMIKVLQKSTFGGFAFATVSGKARSRYNVFEALDVVHDKSDCKAKLTYQNSSTMLFHWQQMFLHYVPPCLLLTQVLVTHNDSHNLMGGKILNQTSCHFFQMDEKNSWTKISTLIVFIKMPNYQLFLQNHWQYDSTWFIGLPASGLAIRNSLVPPQAKDVEMVQYTTW